MGFGEFDLKGFNEIEAKFGVEDRLLEKNGKGWENEWRLMGARGFEGLLNQFSKGLKLIEAIDE